MVMVCSPSSTASGPSSARSTGGGDTGRHARPYERICGLSGCNIRRNSHPPLHRAGRLGARLEVRPLKLAVLLPDDERVRVPPFVERERLEHVVGRRHELDVLALAARDELNPCRVQPAHDGRLEWVLPADAIHLLVQPGAFARTLSHMTLGSPALRLNAFAGPFTLLQSLA
jgi:hypothetical protein